MKVSLIIPAYNEEYRIIKTLEQASSYMDAVFTDYEIIIADDGSSDGTCKVVEPFLNQHIKLYKLMHGGKGETVKQAMLQATGDYLFFLDADLPYSLDNIKIAVDIFRKDDPGLVIGARDLFNEISSSPYPWYRSIMSNVFSFIVNMVLKLNIKDTQCGFKGFKRDIAHQIFPFVTINGFGFDIELLFIARKHNIAITRIPVELIHSEGSKVFIIKDTIKMICDIVKVKSNNRKAYYDRNSNYVKNSIID